jgi:hypothetical protein
MTVRRLELPAISRLVGESLVVWESGRSGIELANASELVARGMESVMEPGEDKSDRARYLALYLQDHHAGAEAGVRLVRRCRDHADPAFVDQLSQLVTDIEDDFRSLKDIMTGLHVDPSVTKQVAGVAAERLGRLKLNGRLLRRSPLSMVVELEGLIGAVAIKRQLWSTLRSLAGDRREPDSQLDSLIARAEHQRLRLESIHTGVVADVFATPQGAQITTPNSGTTPAAAR